MHQAGVVALPQEVKQVQCGIHVGSERVAQVRIKIGQPRAVHHQIERLCQSRLRRLIEAQPRRAHIAFDNFNLVLEQRT